jgi:AcrR family transcriptional regulator
LNEPSRLEYVFCAMKRATRVPRASALEPRITFQPRRSPAQARSRDTVAVILTAATRLFAASGYDATTTNHIAERAGVSVGSLYEYFPSKDAILVALAEAHLEEAQRIVRDATRELLDVPADLETTVRTVVCATVKVHALDPDLHRVLSEEASRSPRVRSTMASLKERGVRWWERQLRARPELPARDPALAAVMVFEAIESMTHRVVIHGDGTIPLERYVDEIVALIVGYLRSS